MSSIVKLGMSLYLKVSESLQREDMDDLIAIYKEFEKSAEQSFIFDFTALRSASEKACYVLASVLVMARKKGRVYVLTPRSYMLEQLLVMQVIKTSEIYENRNLIAQAMKDIVKGNIPEV